MVNDHFYLQNILESIARIELYVEGFDEEAFQADSKTQDAVIRQLEIIGEAARLLSDETKTASPKVPWRSISGMRNHLIHRYFKVDLSEVWRTSESDLPGLKTEVTKILESLKEEEN